MTPRRKSPPPASLKFRHPKKSSPSNPDVFNMSVQQLAPDTANHGTSDPLLVQQPQKQAVFKIFPNLVPIIPTPVIQQKEISLHELSRPSDSFAPWRLREKYFPCVYLLSPSFNLHFEICILQFEMPPDPRPLKTPLRISHSIRPPTIILCDPNATPPS
jgi:hypothetical protein